MLLLVAPERAGPWIGLQQAMDCLRLDASTLGQALCSATGRCTERDRDGLGGKNLQQRIDERGLPNAGPTGDDHHIRDECDPERCFLAVSKRQLRPLLDPRDGFIDINGRPGQLSGGERLELLGDFALGSVKCSKEDAAAAFEIVGNDGTILELKTQCCLDQFGWYFEQLFGERNEFFDRKTAMPFVHRLRERVGDPGAHADQRRLLDTELGCDLIGGAETDAADVAGQAIGVLRDELHRVGAVGLVDTHRARRADAVAVQEQHDLADDPLLGPAGDDTRRTLWADPGHLAQALRFLLDDVEHGFAEGPHQLLRVDRPDAADHPGAEIFLDALDRRRRRSPQKRGSELDAVRTVVDPASARLDELAGRDHRGVAENRDQVALPTSFDPQHAEAVIGVVEGDALDETGQNLGWRARVRFSRHLGMMEIKILGRYRDQSRRRYGCARPYQLAQKAAVAAKLLPRFMSISPGPPSP